MKKILLIVVALATVASIRAADTVGPLAEKLQKGLFEEEANHNLSAAIDQYKGVITQGDEQRKLVGTALFRLGESYRKLGRTNEAEDAFTRVARDFSDQKELAQRASTHLSQLGKPVEGASSEGGSRFDAIAHLLDTSPDLLNAINSPTNDLTFLQEATTKGDIAFMQFLIQRGASVDKDVKRHGPPLSLAAERGNKKAVELLLGAGANINAQWQTDGTTPLHRAALHGYVQLSQFLIEKGAQVNSADSYGSTPLHLAAQAGQVEEIGFLVKNGGDLRAVNRGEDTPLLYASASRQNLAVKALLELGSEANAQDKDGRSSLHYAVGGVTRIHPVSPTAGVYSPPNQFPEVHLPTVEVLLQFHANPDLTDKEGLTPLFYAAYAGSLRAAELLLEAKANVNAKDKGGLHPLAYAKDESMMHLLEKHGGVRSDRSAEDTDVSPAKDSLLLNQTEEIKALARLLDNGPDLLNAPFTNGMTLLQNAVTRGDLEAVRYLVQRGAAINGDPQGGAGPPLVVASEAGNKAAVEFLSEKGADVNVHALNGAMTPLLAAAGKGFIQISELLLEKGADVNARNGYGQTPLHHAASGGHADEIALLAKHGATLTATDTQGDTPLSTAIRHDHADAVAALVKGGVDPNKPDAKGELPIVEAMQRNGAAEKLVQTLLDHGANPDAQDQAFGATPLEAAAGNYNRTAGAPEIFKVLLSGKADPNIKDKLGDTALHEAVGSTFNLLTVSESLLEHGADPNIQNNDGRTALHYAVGASAGGGIVWSDRGFGRYAIQELEIKPTAESTMRYRLSVKEPEIELLLKHGASPNLPDKDGRTPLFYAAYANSSAAVRMLLNAKADLNAKDKLGRTPLDFAPLYPASQFGDSNAAFNALKNAGGTNTIPANASGLRMRLSPQSTSEPTQGKAGAASE
ncbi:MAG TPA: ankyrin repeat domain-containing protein [Verrucomicrobiae bacterium]|nr:ankyrin repeat domain-containing protein [Verrucomicrobiae bacterium]